VSLLELRDVGKSYAQAQAERVVLRDVTLELDGGELAVVWGVRGSGRSTLLRLAAGIERPDAGLVRFAGEDLAGRGGELLGAGIGFCQTPLPRGEWRSVFDQVMVSLLARGLPPRVASARSAVALDRVGAGACLHVRLADLEAHETVRVAIARVLALEPRLLVIDEPTKGIDQPQRDDILALLRSLADEGIAVLASTGESPALAGADRALALGDGQLRGPPRPQLAPVLPLRGGVAHRARG
jgi:energy-coupling factor transporter ATP-binding protein EcfA2